jgi:GPH family glycoside/pentoside/hexuronide:cation symporter
MSNNSNEKTDESTNLGVDSDKVKLKSKIGYAFGAVPNAILIGVFSYVYVDFFFNDLQMEPVLWFIGLTIYTVVNMFNDPLLGVMSDKTNRERWGSRRIVYIRYGGILWGVSFILIWFPWSYTDQIIIFLHFIVILSLFETMYTLVVLAWLALLPEMTASINERNITNFIVLLFGIVGSLFIGIVIGIRDTMPLLDFQIAATIIGIVCIIFFQLLAKFTYEKPEFQKDEVFPLVKSLKLSIKSKSFLWYVGFNFFTILNAALGAPLIFAFVMVLGNTPEVSGLYFALLFVGGYFSPILGMILYSKWKDMRKLSIIAGIITIIVRIVCFLLIFLPGDDIPILWTGTIIGTLLGGIPSFFANQFMMLSMDEDEVNHGSRREGAFLGINALFTKPAETLAPGIATALLLIFAFIQGAPFEAQPDSAVFGIKFILLVLPAIITAISLVFVYFYPLYGEKLTTMQENLKKMHEEKRAKLNT